MKKRLIIKSEIILLLTGLLTAFFYVHETFPKPIRAATALLGTRTAIASGLCYYLKLDIPVYDTPIAVVFSNLVASTGRKKNIRTRLNWQFFSRSCMFYWT